MRELRRGLETALYPAPDASHSICSRPRYPWSKLMSRGQKPLLLMMALSMPGAGHALGLGDIHVNSKLNEPLAAEIDIVGATADELMGLRASLANRETFQRFGFERPAFLSSTTFKVTQDGQGHPVLMLRSSDSFTDPLVSILVDLDWGHG